MADEHPDLPADDQADDAEVVLIERMVLANTEAGRLVSARFVKRFGEFIGDEVRPVLRELAAEGSDPQLLVNGLAELLRLTADSIEFPVGRWRELGGASAG
jgi:hypothetical protein